MKLEQTVEKIPAHTLGMNLVEWQNKGWEVASFAPASSLRRRFPEGMGEEVREYQVVLRRPMSGPV